MAKSLFWIWLLLTIIGLVCDHKNVKLETFVQDIKKCFKYSPVSSTIIVAIIVVVISICNQKLFGNKETSVENKESLVVAEEQAMQSTDSMAKVEDNTDIEVSSGNGKVKSGVEIAKEKVDKESREGQDSSQDNVFQESVDEDTEIAADEPQEDFDAGRDSPVWSSDYAFWYIKSNGIMDAYDYVDMAKSFLEQENELEATSTPVYLKLNKKMMGNDYYSLTSNESEYTYVGELEDNRPSGFGVLKIWSIDAGEPLRMYCGNFSKGRYDGKGIKFGDYSESTTYWAVSALEDRVSDIKEYLENISYIGNFSEGEATGYGMRIVSPDLYDYANTIITGTDEDVEAFERNRTDLGIAIGTFTKGVMGGSDCKLYSQGFLWYEGGVKDDYFNGEGTMYYPCSYQIEYQGHWRNSEYNGEGTLYDENGEIVYAGEWENGDYAS